MLPRSGDAAAVLRAVPDARTLRIDAGAKVFHTEKGSLAALADVDLSVAPGEFVSVLGPSGCGKSTLMAILAGLETPSAGQVTLGGQLVKSPLLDAGFMFQRDLLLDWRTCEKNVLLQFEMRGEPSAPHRARVLELLDLVGMGEFAHRYPRELSGGMRQRVAICRALVHNPSLLFLDEPFGALDALTRESLNVELSSLTKSTGSTVVLVTHSIEEAVFMGDRVVVMSHRPGRIVGDVRIDLPRPRRIDVLEDPQLVGYAGQLRRMLALHGAIQDGADDRNR